MAATAPIRTDRVAIDISCPYRKTPCANRRPARSHRQIRVWFIVPGLEFWAGMTRAGCPSMSFCQDPLVVASYCCTTLAGMRPRPLTAMPCSFAQARMSPLRCRLEVVRGRRCPRPALRACSMNGASCLRNAAVCLLFRSISYSVPPTANRTVSSAGPPSRSSSSAMVIFVAIPASLIALGYLHRTRSTAMPRYPPRASCQPAHRCTRPAAQCPAPVAAWARIAAGGHLGLPARWLGRGLGGCPERDGP
jgi:hypothetical protein